MQFNICYLKNSNIFITNLRQIATNFFTTNLSVAKYPRNSIKLFSFMLSLGRKTDRS